ncbi:hypothetical protein CLUG_03040 [Clavispora lusitaniae ATCC 42720]|uniref:glucan endo-1,3-beta-D-glucosidase n=1 Tax=Clavispora lusitaniae (strain ATCC 42720) TaxID=306902 RepID=C4Y3C7_CLAL4|nr:uncharacterized protein CLUG_03040 [Clavispora lusitaniae ATCC 42720]EEQ38914.1 hypothetical protein CLUG_03040 [Clavispora lusitaniae ATCC 42720]
MTDIFAIPISTSAPSSIFPWKAGEVSVPANTSNASPLQTNSFYSNMLVGDQTTPVWTYPYCLWNSTSNYYGLSVFLGLESDRVFASGTPPQYFYSPIGIQEVVLSSSDFVSPPAFSLQKTSKFAATVRFSSKSVDNSYFECPLVQGMGFVTGIYHNSIPMLNSSVGFASVVGQQSPRGGINKYKITLHNNRVWFLYIALPRGKSVSLALKDSNTIWFSNSVDGAVLQLCSTTDYTGAFFDNAAGCYSTDASISATVNSNICSYALTHNVAGNSNTGEGLIFALPHHIPSFDSNTASKATGVTFPSTKGTVKAYSTKVLTMKETLPTSLGFEPYTSLGKSPNYTSNALAAISAAAKKEAVGDVVNDSNVDSMYTSGKILAKYAYVLYVCNDILKDTSLVNTLLPKLKTAIERFTSNSQKYPLYYDTSFKGIVSSAKEDADYGNSHYNDHHFHWGYHIQAIAITSYVDKKNNGTWINSVKDWVTTLIRDVANPSSGDDYFPVSRSFDFYNGHSWAKGLYPSSDGKDEESSSEDYNFAYSMKLWAKVSDDYSMEQRANLILAIMKRSINSYFLYTDDNTVEPKSFIPNKVSGILFDNKIDHTTYFGQQTQYIHGIHMLPITPCSSYIRSPTFVEQEWNQKLNGVINSVADGWKGILMLNVALFDPDTAYKFFSSSSFSNNFLDNGMSLTWALAYCAGVGASS